MGFLDDENKLFASFTPSEREMLDGVLRMVSNAPSVDEAKRLLDSRDSGDIQFENRQMQSVGFAFRPLTQDAVRTGLLAELGAWILFIFICIFSFVVGTLTGGGAPLIKRMVDSARVQLRLNRRQAVAIGRDAVEELRHDSRPPILFLRSFSSQYSNSRDVKDLRTLEERLADSYKQYGPLIAVGRPEDRVPTLGALKLYFDDVTWQAGVSYLMTICQLVIIEIGISEGTLWELGMAKRVLPPERLMISLSDPVTPDEVEHKYYLMFKKYLEEIIGWDLPSNIGPYPGGHYIRFGADWEPMFYDAQSRQMPQLISTRKGTA